MKKEIWKPVVGFEGLYSISSQGNLRAEEVIIWKTGRKGTRFPYRKKASPKKLTLNNMGYFVISLYRDGIKYDRTVHSLVADAFLGQRPKGYHTDHVNGNPLINTPENLEYVTARENISRGKATSGKLRGTCLVKRTGKYAATKAWAVNKTGRDLRLGDVAAIDTTPWASDPLKSISEGIVLTLKEPEAEDWGLFVVCADKIADNAGGWVYERGIVLARVMAPLGSGDDEYLHADLDVIDTDAGDPYVLRMHPFGHARVLKRTEESPAEGEVWAFVRFPVQPPMYATAVDDEDSGRVLVKLTDACGNEVGDEVEVATGTECGS